MNRTIISIILLGLIIIFSENALVNATEVTAENSFREIGTCDMSEYFNWPASLATCNDNYGFFSGHHVTIENNKQNRTPYLVIVDLESMEIVSNIAHDWQVKSICASNEYLYVLHSINRRDHLDETVHLRIFDLSDPGNISLLEHELVFRINDGILLLEGDNLILLARRYTKTNANTRIYRMDNSNPAKPQKLTSSFIDVKDIRAKIGDDGKTLQDENGKTIYTLIKDQYYSVIGKASNAKLNGDYLYTFIDNDIWSFDLEGRNEKGERTAPEEKRPYYMGKFMGQSFYSPNNLDMIYDYCWSDTVENKFLRGGFYFYIVGKSEDTFGITERVIGDRTLKMPTDKYGIYVFHSTHMPYSRGNGATKVTRGDQMSQLELSFTPLSIQSNGNWVYILGYEKIYGEELERIKRVGKLCLLDSFNPKEIKLVDTTDLDWYPHIVQRKGNKLIVVDLQSTLHVLEMTLEDKGFSKEIYRTATKADKKRSQRQTKKGTPRFYTFRYQGYDMAYRDKISIAKYQIPKTRILDWQLGGYTKGIIFNNWEHIPYEIRQQFRSYTSSCIGGI